MKKNKNTEHTFCMQQFKPAIIVMAILLVMVLSWSIWHCTQHPKFQGYTLAAANTPTPSAPPVDVNAKMLHPYWGNCSKCHVVTGVGKPVSKVMTGPPISIKDKMLHKYWGNCMLCHVITDGIPGKKKTTPAKGQAVAFQQTQTNHLGLQVQTVNANLMHQFALPAKNGAIVLQIAPGSSAEVAGFLPGDLIVRFGKDKINSANALTASIGKTTPGRKIKAIVYRGKISRSLFVTIPNGSMPPMTQNQVETRAEQLGVPKTPQAVNQALQQQRLQQQNIQQPNMQQQMVNNQAQWVAATTPMTQNQIETMAEQLGVPKTQSAVQQALKKQQQLKLAAATPMTQNQIETMAEQLGVPKTQSAVQQALKKQQQAKVAANPYYGKVAIASSGTSLGSPVSIQFDTSPYFIITDPIQRSYKVVANPNANDPGNQGIQTSQYMVDLNVENVVAGNFSPSAINSLSMLRINIYSGVTGSVSNIINAYLSGQLIPKIVHSMQQAPMQQFPMQQAPMSGTYQNAAGGMIY